VDGVGKVELHSGKMCPLLLWLLHYTHLPNSKGLQIMNYRDESKSTQS